MLEVGAVTTGHLQFVHVGSNRFPICSQPLKTFNNNLCTRVYRHANYLFNIYRNKIYCFRECEHFTMDAARTAPPASRHSSPTFATLNISVSTFFFRPLRKYRWYFSTIKWRVSKVDMKLLCCLVWGTVGSNALIHNEAWRLQLIQWFHRKGHSIHLMWFIPWYTRYVWCFHWEEYCTEGDTSPPLLLLLLQFDVPFPWEHT